MRKGITGRVWQASSLTPMESRSCNRVHWKWHTQVHVSVKKGIHEGCI